MYVLIVLLVIISLILILVGYYAYRNLHLDDIAMKKVHKSGYVEKQVSLPNGTVLNYGEGGNAQNTPLLLIHGQGQAWEDYDAVLPSLADSFHVFAVDCHGHGQSSKNVERYTCKFMVEDFIWFIQNVIGKPCVISGHSSGGILATSVASSSPSDILALIIEDAPFFCVEPEEMKSKNAFVWIDSFKPIHDFVRQDKIDYWPYYYIMNGYLWSLFGGLRDKVAESALKYSRKHTGKPLKIWYVPQSMLRGSYYIHYQDFNFSEKFYDGSWFDGTNQEEILRGVKCPCTYLKAHTGYVKDGKPVPLTDGMDTTGLVLSCANTEEDAAHVVELIPGCKKVVTPTSDHLIHQKYPSVFITQVLKYANS